MFVDIHNHILPGIDDGAPTLDYALDMARQAVAGGTDIMVATPHRAWAERRGAHPDWVTRRVVKLQAALDTAHIPLRIVPGVEIPVGPRVADEITLGELGTLGSASKYVLVEPPFDRIPHDALDNLHAILQTGVKIVLAHPERNAEVQKHLAFVEACADLGLSFQLTTGSILGRMGPAAQRAAEAILHYWREWSIVIASDSHNLFDRQPSWMPNARDAVAPLVGTEEAEKMVNTRPRAIVLGHELP